MSNERRTTVRVRYRGYVCPERKQRLVEVVAVREDARDLVPHPALLDPLEAEQPWAVCLKESRDEHPNHQRLLAASLAADLLGGDVDLAADLADSFRMRLAGQLVGNWDRPASELARLLLECLQAHSLPIITAFRRRAAAGQNVTEDLAAYRQKEVEAIFRLSEMITPLASSAYVHFKPREEDDGGDPW